MQAVLIYGNVSGVYSEDAKKRERVVVGLLILIVFILLFGSDTTIELIKAILKIALFLFAALIIFIIIFDG